MVVTRAWRERMQQPQGGGPAQRPTFAVLRVRFPEGVCLQVGHARMQRARLPCPAACKFLPACFCLLASKQAGKRLSYFLPCVLLASMPHCAALLVRTGQLWRP